MGDGIEVGTSVLLTGLSAEHAFANNCIGEVLYRKKERLVVALSPNMVDLCVGDSVALCSLNKRRDLNGKSGSLKEYEQEKERWTVTFNDTEEIVCVLERNLRKIVRVPLECASISAFKFGSQEQALAYNKFVEDEKEARVKECTDMYNYVRGCIASGEVQQLCGNNCGKEATQRCGKCKSVCYCSRACQKAHYSTHKVDCAKWQAVDMRTCIIGQKLVMNVLRYPLPHDEGGRLMQLHNQFVGKMNLMTQKENEWESKGSTEISPEVVQLKKECIKLKEQEAAGWLALDDCFGLAKAKHAVAILRLVAGECDTEEEIDRLIDEVKTLCTKARTLEQRKKFKLADEYIKKFEDEIEATDFSIALQMKTSIKLRQLARLARIVRWDEGK